MYLCSVMFNVCTSYSMSNFELSPLGRHVLSILIQCLSLSYLVRSSNSCCMICIVMFVNPCVLKCLYIGRCV